MDLSVPSFFFDPRRDNCPRNSIAAVNAPSPEHAHYKKSDRVCRLTNVYLVDFLPVAHSSVYAPGICRNPE